VLLGGLFFSLGVYGLGWYKAPFAIGTIPRTVVILSVIWGGMGLLGYRIWMRGGVEISFLADEVIIRSGCNP
jgi:hypothetical protein